MRSPIYRKGAAYNWQLNGAAAAVFLNKMLPHLRIKREQAEFAVAWQGLKQVGVRGKNGQMLPVDQNRKIDIGASNLLKELKRKDIDAVMAAQNDLVEIVHTLKQIVCIKG